mgnify:CR=1 FL=1
MQIKYRVFMEADLERVTMLEEYTVLADSGDPEERIVSVHIDTPTEGHLLNRDEDI